MRQLCFTLFLLSFMVRLLAEDLSCISIFSGWDRYSAVCVFPLISSEVLVLMEDLGCMRRLYVLFVFAC